MLAVLRFMLQFCLKAKGKSVAIFNVMHFGRDTYGNLLRPQFMKGPAQKPGLPGNEDKLYYLPKWATFTCPGHEYGSLYYVIYYVQV